VGLPRLAYALAFGTWNAAGPFRMEVVLNRSRWPAWPGVAVVLVCATTAALAQQTKPAAGTHPRTGAARSTTTTRTRAARKPGRVDGVAAVVNDEVVLQSDVEDQVYVFLSANPGASPDSATVDTLRHQVLDRLIDEKLLVAEAKRQGLTATDAEVKRQVDSAIQDARQRLGEDGFKAQLDHEGLTEERLRAKYHDQAERQILVDRVVHKHIEVKPVSPTDAEAYFKANPEKFPKAPPELKLSVIQIPARPDSAADVAAKAKVVAARQRIVGGERFAKVAADVSDDPSSARSGGDLGFFSRGQMDPSIEDAAFAMPLNQVSQPIHSAFGWHIIEVLERDSVKTRDGRDSLDASGKPVPEAHVRHILSRVQITQDDADRAEKLAKRVHAEAIKGGDFGALVKRYSQYQGPVGPGGDLGFVSLATLQPTIRAGLDSLSPGQVSEVLANQVGYNIFKVTDRKPERPYAIEEIKDELPEAVQQIQFRERLAEWVKELRGKAHIKINA
jgi:peptidyl-prolyl cis-trans isomerase SurA